MPFTNRPLLLRLATGEREANDRPGSTLTKGPVWPGATPSLQGGAGGTNTRGYPEQSLQLVEHHQAVLRMS